MSLISTFAVLVLLFAGGYFTFCFKGFYFRHPIKTLRAMPLENGVKEMLLSLGGTVGVGNISGVAVAIMIGGSGAVLWMWVGAFFAMALKYAEITLGVAYRRDASHYIKKVFGGFAAALFSLLLIADCIMMGGIIQANAICEAMDSAFGITPVLCGILLCVLTAAILFFRVNLFSLSMYVVPFMSALYIVMALSVILYFADGIVYVFKDIFVSAFDISSASGGIVGILFTPAVRQGIVKGLFSNEAGCGTAPSAHAETKEKVPARQGLFGIFEVFVDTVLMCTITAFAILLALGKDPVGMGGIDICLGAFERVLASYASPLLALCIFLFAFSAILSFGYYGISTVGEKFREPFILVFCLSLFAGSLLSPMKIWYAADTVISMMLIINTSAVFAHRKKVLFEHGKLFPHRKEFAKRI